MRSRARWVALVAGLGLVLVSCGLTLVLPAVLEPPRPWTDVEVQQAEWGATVDRILLTACGSGALGLILTVVGAYRPGSSGRERRK